MDKTIIGLLGGASALALMGGVQAAPAPAAAESSFAELLDPIPNAVERLNADDQRATTSDTAADERPVQLAQYHHHHHQHYHHHHYHHHHYHHHHHYY